MPDINLLPEDKRGEKEFEKKIKKTEQVQYTNPSKESDPLKSKKGGVMDYFQQLIAKLKRKEFLKPTEIIVERPVTESYSENLKKKEDKSQTGLIKKVDETAKTPKVRVVETIKPQMSFWQRWKLAQEEKDRKNKMMKMKEVVKQPSLTIRANSAEETKQVPVNQVNIPAILPKTEKRDQKKEKIIIREEPVINNEAVFPNLSRPKKDKKSLIELIFRRKPVKQQKLLTEIAREDFQQPAIKTKENQKSVEKKKLETKQSQDKWPVAKQEKSKMKKPKLNLPPPEAAEEEIEVNLLPQKIEIKEIALSKFVVILLNSILITLIIISLIYFSVYSYVNSVKNKIVAADHEIVSIHQEIFGLESQTREALTLQKRIDLIQTLLRDHVYWSQFFAFLEKNTIQEVYFSGLQGGKTGLLVLSGVAKNFTAVGEQLQVFESNTNFIQKANVDIAQLQKTKNDTDTGYVHFNLYLQLKPGIFKKY